MHFFFHKVSPVSPVLEILPSSRNNPGESGDSAELFDVPPERPRLGGSKAARCCCVGVQRQRSAQMPLLFSVR
jgi:hypothetical protein